MPIIVVEWFKACIVFSYSNPKTLEHPFYTLHEYLSEG
jgi:hypothetical protein